MEIGPLSRISVSAPVAADAVPENPVLMRQLIAAIRGLNQPEFSEQGREFKLRRRAPGRRPMVDVVDRETGEVLDELPPEEVLRMMAELDKQPEEDL